jgi:ABC-type arginine/histidine transport system permease subunit
MSTAETLFLLLVAMLVGSVITLALALKLVLRSEHWLDLKSKTMETVLRDMYGHDVDSLNKELARHR